MTTAFETESIALVHEASALVEARLSEFTSRPGFVARHISAGFLARCLSLLKGIETLGSSEHEDLCGLLFRALVESCLLGLYVVLGGPEALAKVMGDHRRNVLLIADRNNSKALREFAEEWPVPNGRVSLEQVAKDLGPLLEAFGDRNADASGIYDAAYRADSTFSVHGVGAALRYLEVQGDPWKVSVRPELLGTDPATYMILGSLYMTYFAGIGLKEWGYSTNEVADLLVRITKVADLNSPTSPASRSG